MLTFGHPPLPTGHLPHKGGDRVRARVSIPLKTRRPLLCPSRVDGRPAPSRSPPLRGDVRQDRGGYSLTRLSTARFLARATGQKSRAGHPRLAAASSISLQRSRFEGDIGSDNPAVVLDQENADKKSAGPPVRRGISARPRIVSIDEEAGSASSSAQRRSALIAFAIRSSSSSAAKTDPRCREKSRRTRCRHPCAQEQCSVASHRLAPI